MRPLSSRRSMLAGADGDERALGRFRSSRGPAVLAKAILKRAGCRYGRRSEVRVRADFISPQSRNVWKEQHRNTLIVAYPRSFSSCVVAPRRAIEEAGTPLFAGEARLVAPPEAAAVPLGVRQPH